MSTNEEILQSRIKTTANVIQPYLRKEFADQISVIDEIQNCITESLTAIGVDSTDIGMKILMAPTTTANDFESALKDNVSTLIPSPRVKAVWQILIGQDPFATKEVKSVEADANTNLVHSPELVQTIVKTLEQQKPIGQWTDINLLKDYGKNSLPQIEEELLKRSKCRPCILFNDDGKVLVTESLDLLKQARHTSTPSSYLVGKKLYKVYKVGDFPGDITYECPIHSNILLVNGYCEECGLKWDNFEENKRKYIFLRLLSETTAIEPISLRAYLGQDFDYLAILHPKIAMKFKDLEEEEKLPVLKHRYSNSKNGDPFRVVHKEY